MIKVDSIKPINGAGNLRAFATVTINDKVKISDVRIVQQPNQAAWVSMPTREYKNKDGQRKWSNIVEILDEQLKKQIEAAVLAEFEKLQPAATREVWK